MTLIEAAGPAASGAENESFDSFEEDEEEEEIDVGNEEESDEEEVSRYSSFQCSNSCQTISVH